MLSSAGFIRPEARNKLLHPAERVSGIFIRILEGGFVMVKRITRYLLIGLLATSVSGAQESRGTLAGRVTDASGAVIGGAQIQITNTQTGVIIPTQTNDQGLFKVPFLIPSVYSVTIEHSGFKRLVRENVLVLIDSTVQLDVSLTVGEVSQQVAVTAAPPLLEYSEPHRWARSLNLSRF